MPDQCVVPVRANKQRTVPSQLEPVTTQHLQISMVADPPSQAGALPQPDQSDGEASAYSQLQQQETLGETTNFPEAQTQSGAHLAGQDGLPEDGAGRAANHTTSTDASERGKFGCQRLGAGSECLSR